MSSKKPTAIAAKPNYEPTAAEKDAIEKARHRITSGPVPRISVVNRTLILDHPEPSIGFVLLANALGTTDQHFLEGLLAQLVKAATRGEDVGDVGLNFMVAVIKDIEPKDQVETMLAAQMAAVQMLMMRFTRQLGNVENIPQQDSAERALNKLARTFTTQMEALKRYRSGGEQKVTVQHVSVSEGGQAIVGNVTQTPQNASPDKAATSPPSLTHSQTPAMPIVSEPVPEATPRKRKSRK